MPRNGSGTFSYTPSTWYPAVDGVTATADDWNDDIADDIATALTGSVSADGQTPMTGNLDMGNNRVVDMAAAVAITDAANANDVQSGRLCYLTSVSGVDTITASLTGFTAYAAGQTFRFPVAGANTGAVTLNINAVGAKAITKNGTVALAAGDIVASSVIEVIYDGTQFQLVGARSYVLGTVAASTSGSSIDFTGIPPWAKKVTINFAGVSTNGTANPVVQIGDAGGLEPSSYVGSSAGGTNGVSPGVVGFTTGFGIASALAANVFSGSITVSLVDPATNTWVASGVLSTSTAFITTAGSKSLSGVLDRISLVTTDTFDAGKVNIDYEG